MNTISYKHFSLAAQLDQLRSENAEAIERVNTAKQAGELGFAKLLQADVTEIQELADSVANNFKTVAVVGIGGSDLGARAVHRALNHQFYNLDAKFRQGRPRLFFLGDTTDPVAVQEVLDVVEWPETAIVMISKSGNTVEQMSTFLTLRKQLIEAVGEEKAREHIFIITDATSGSLRKITDQEGYRGLVHPEVGGRFSVLSCVGLFPLAIAGIDVKGLLRGAAEQETRAQEAADYALLQYAAYQHGQHISVLMPYTYSLREVGFWFRQLWAESLGKRLSLDGQVVEVGPTPIAAVGPTDQHSQIQLYREGPNDKIFTFVRVERPKLDVAIPEAFPELDSVHYLSSHHLQEILMAEQESTAAALAEAGRSSCTMSMPQLTAESLGELLYFFELATTYAGQLFNVNAFDQPGVERGKELMYSLLGHK